LKGSNDGETWLEYEFKYKPGDVRRAPPDFVAPHQPRLDWQMWFAALGSERRDHPWFVSFEFRLLRNSPDVAGLLKKNPFSHDATPNTCAASLYEYHFTDRAARRKKTGAWWKRELKGVYLRSDFTEGF